MRKALFEKATGKVVNLILVDEGAAWQPPVDHDVVSAENAKVAVGDRWNGTKFVAHVPTAEEKAAAAQAAKDDALIRDVLLEKGRRSLEDWDNLFTTSGQKFAVVKALLAYVLRKEGR